MEYCGIEIALIERDHAQVKVQIKPGSTNPCGFAHGGLLFTLADCTADYTASSYGRTYVMQSSHFNFSRNRKSGGHIR